jgi:hypothetical protein
VKTLSKIENAKIRDEMKTAGLDAEILPEVWEMDWM